MYTIYESVSASRNHLRVTTLKHIQNFIDTSESTDIFFQAAFTEESCLHWKGFPIQIVIDVKLVITFMLYTFEKIRVGGANASIRHFLSASLLANGVWASRVAPITVHRWLARIVYISYLEFINRNLRKIHFFGE